MFVYKEYNRNRAVEYAEKWALSRNPLFLTLPGEEETVQISFHNAFTPAAAQ